jgi:hypothetical protein
MSLYKKDFLATALAALAAGATKVHVTDFTSRTLHIGHSFQSKSLIFTFTRAAGTANTVDFAFEVSVDGGTTWATLEQEFKIPTNQDPVSTTVVRVVKELEAITADYIRLKSITNNDGVNALSALNVTLIEGM